MLRNSTLAVALLFALTVFCHAQTTKPVSAIEHVYVISIDGLRPDVLLRADAPNLRGMMNDGCFTMWANTTDVAITLPSHVSMMTGVNPDRHKIDWNGDVPDEQFHYPAAPTIFDLAHAQGLKTAMVAGKSKFKAMARREVFDAYSVPPQGSSADSALAMIAADVIRTERPNVMLIHLPNVDGAGHGEGWGSPAQVQAAGQADRCVGIILDAIDAAGLRDSTAIIVSADHGGAGLTHGGLDPRSRHIPWIVRGPGIRANYDLTGIPELVVNTTDTFATACYLLGITAPDGIDGKPIFEILNGRPLPEDAAPPAAPAR